MAANAIVTRDSMRAMLTNDNPQYVIAVVGRALVAIFQRQTEAEKSANVTDNHNGIGFSGTDAKSGSLTAKYFLKNKTLQQWQVDNWTRVVNGYPRLCKYHKQLNEIAQTTKRTQPVDQISLIG